MEVECGIYDFQVKNVKPLSDKQKEELKSLCLWALRRLHKTYKDFAYDEYERIIDEEVERI